MSPESAGCWASDVKASNADIATKAALSRSNQQLGITEANHAQGRENYLNAASILGGTAKAMKPVEFAGAAETAGNEAFGSATKIDEEDMAGEQEMMRLLGGAIQGGMSFVSGGLRNLSKDSSFEENVGNFFSGGATALG